MGHPQNTNRIASVPKPHKYPAAFLNPRGRLETARSHGQDETRMPSRRFFGVERASASREGSSVPLLRTSPHCAISPSACSSVQERTPTAERQPQEGRLQPQTKPRATALCHRAWELASLHSAKQPGVGFVQPHLLCLLTNNL